MSSSPSISMATPAASMSSSSSSSSDSLQLSVSQTSIQPCQQLTTSWNGGTPPYDLFASYVSTSNSSHAPPAGAYTVASGMTSKGSAYSYTGLVLAPSRSDLTLRIVDGYGRSASTKVMVTFTDDEWCLEDNQHSSPSSSVSVSSIGSPAVFLGASSTQANGTPVTASSATETDSTSAQVNSDTSGRTKVLLASLLTVFAVLLVTLVIVWRRLRQMRQKYAKLESTLTSLRWTGSLPGMEEKSAPPSQDSSPTSPSSSSSPFASNTTHLSRLDAAHAVQLRSVSSTHHVSRHGLNRQPSSASLSTSSLVTSSENPFDDSYSSAGSNTDDMSSLTSSARISNRHRFSTISALAAYEDGLGDSDSQGVLTPRARSPSRSLDRRSLAESDVTGVSGPSQSGLSVGGQSAGGVSAVSDEHYSRRPHRTIVRK